MTKMDPKTGPRSTQDRPKTGPRSSWLAFFSSSIFASILNRFRLRFGSVWGSQMDPWAWGKKVRIAPLAGPSRSGARLGTVFRLTCGWRSLFGASSAPLDTIWGRSWGHFRPPWVQFWVRECSLGVFLHICLSMFACHFSICGLSLWSFAFRFVDASFGFPSGSIR